jgi:glycosyltransferase involved in cell wall biosynthesis
VTTKRILALTTSPLPVGNRITDGPGFRMWSLLRELGKEHSIHVLSLYESYHSGTPDPQIRSTPEGFQIESPSHRPQVIQGRIRAIDPDVLYLPWQCTIFLGRSNLQIPTILDYVGPGLLEEFVAHGRIPSELVRLFLDSFGYGDLILTTTRRERYFLIGLITASERLSRVHYDRTDPLVEVVRMTPPTGSNVADPIRHRNPEDPLTVLLAGAFLPWYDYAPLAQAVGALEPALAAKVHVLVLGGNPRNPQMVERVQKTLTSGPNASCFRFIGLVPFAERLHLYHQADVALSIGANSVEDELSARTRVVDYLGAGLPVLSSGRDEYASEIIAAGAGFRYESATELAGWLGRLVREPPLLSEARARIPPLLEGPFNGNLAARPVIGFIDHPRLLARHIGRRARLRSAGLWVRDLSAFFR